MADPMPSTLDPGATATTYTLTPSPIEPPSVAALAFAWGMAGAFVGAAVLAVARAVYRRAKMRAWLANQPREGGGVFRARPYTGTVPGLCMPDGAGRTRSTGPR